MRSTPAGRPLGRLIGLTLATFLAAATAYGQTPEFRAMWVSRFEWPNANPTTCQTTIDTIMQNVAAANFNAVVFQVRGQADVLYPSPYEVWSPLIGGTDPGWDPLAYAINAAHSRGLEFHAYMNTHTCWQSDPAAAHTLPANLNHVFYAHCNVADAAHRDWLHFVNPNNPVQFSESDYVWFAPGVPAFQAYVRQQYVYVVQNYAVDGIHYDRIRTPWSVQPSYDPISLARWANPQSNPDGLTLDAWTTDQITRTVRDIYAAVMAVRPGVKVSAAVYPDPTTAPTNQHQDARTWAQTGGLDILVPMMYSAGGSGSTWDTRLQAWLAGSGGRHVVAGHSTSQGVTSLLEQIALTRLRGAQGNNVFSYNTFSWWSDYLTNVYQVPVVVPAMSWKSSPATAIIYGYVTRPDTQAVVDAQIVRTGSTYKALSTGDGFYSFLLVPPGTYALSASHPGYGPATVSNVTVSAGNVRRQDIVLGAALPLVITEVTPDPDAAVSGQLYSRQLTLAQGWADTWTLTAGPAGATVSAYGYLQWTPDAADAGQVRSFTVRASGPGGFDDESWQVAVTAPPTCQKVTLSSFEGYANGTRVLFRNPRYSGSTSTDLLASPDVAAVTDAVTAYSPTKSYLVQWQFVDTAPDRWMRLTTNTVANLPNPTIALDRPLRVRLQLEGGRLRLCAGVRETGTTAELGADGGTTGTIEWIGAATDISQAPQGVLVEPQPGVWQTLVFDPATDPIHTMTGDGVLWTSTGKGVLEHLAFAVVDSAGPFTVHLDDVEQLCGVPAFGDFDSDGDADLTDFDALVDCLHGPGVIVTGACLAADADADQDVDLRDVAAFQREFTGP